MENDKLNEEQLEALRNFKKQNGRFWKSKLIECWHNGNYRDYFKNEKGKDEVAFLQQARNLGINLDRIKL